MQGIVAAVYSSVFLAFSGAALKQSYRELPASVAFAIDATFAFVLWTPLAFALGFSVENTIKTLPYAVISAVISEALYFYALTKGQLTITAVLLNSFSVYTVFFSVVLFAEKPSGALLLFISITICGTLLVYLPSKFTLAEMRRIGALSLPLFTAVAIGFSDSISKTIIDETGDYSFLLALAIVQIPVALLFLKLEKQSFKNTFVQIRETPIEYKHALAGSFFNVIGTGLLWISFSLVLASIASPIVGTSSALLVMIAIFILDERPNARSFLAILLVCIGIVGIANYA